MQNRTKPHIKEHAAQPGNQTYDTGTIKAPHIITVIGQTFTTLPVWRRESSCYLPGGPATLLGLRALAASCEWHTPVIPAMQQAVMYENGRTPQEEGGYPPPLHPLLPPPPSSPSNVRG